MKRSKKILVLFAVLMMTVMLSGCIEVEMKVNKDGSCDMSYTIDLEQFDGMMTREDLEVAIEESVNDMNKTAGKEITVLKDTIYDEDEDTLTAVITITNINDLDDDSFFGKVKDFRDGDVDLSDMMDAKGKAAKEDKIDDDLNVVYFKMFDDDEYGIYTITVIVPGAIAYVSDGANIESSDTVVFKGQSPIVVYKQGGNMPILVVSVIAGVIILGILFVTFGIKKSSATATETESSFNTSFESKTAEEINEEDENITLLDVAQQPVGVSNEPYEAKTDEDAEEDEESSDSSFYQKYADEVLSGESFIEEDADDESYDDEDTDEDNQE